ncbi:hypothetical protein KI387_027909 [Taxus chinensis]|uniref:Isopenicillin N synthase-like Fe(2+) 2OG dioxygenase domain-containing protein n=1 Tax=Taxus chinensis TaxID=29808 RepID=A0AA38L2R9_TAXCH|nr:hypothetical protein KI387_027909 [Taxus chinensis]
MAVISEALGKDSDYLNRIVGKYTQVMNINYYPACANQDLTFGVAPHLDMCGVIVFIQGDVSSLQVLKDGNWLAVEPSSLYSSLISMPNARLARDDEILPVHVFRYHAVVMTLLWKDLDLINCADLEDVMSSDALEVLVLLAREKPGGASTIPPWVILVESPYSLEPLVRCLAVGLPPVQEKAIEVLSRLCRDQPIVLGDLLAGTCRYIYALAGRVIHSSNLGVKVGSTALLICAAKEHRQRTLDALNESGFFVQLICCLVHMLKHATIINSLRIDRVKNVRGYKIHGGHVEEGDAFSMHDWASILGGTVALWLLSIVSSYDGETKVANMEAGAIEVLTEKSYKLFS